jgi:hypothetical protein
MKFKEGDEVIYKPHQTVHLIKTLHRKDFCILDTGGEVRLSNLALNERRANPAADSMPLSEVQELLEWSQKDGSWQYSEDDKIWIYSYGPEKLSTPDLIKAFKQKNV